jgi:hypothetical protein
LLFQPLALLHFFLPTSTFFLYDRHHLSQKGLAEKRLLERFIAFERQNDMGVDDDGEVNSDSGTNEEGKSRESVSRRHEVYERHPDHASQDADCQDLDCLLDLLEKQPQAVRMRISTQVSDEAPSMSGKESCGVACLIHQIIYGNPNHESGSNQKEIRSEASDNTEDSIHNIPKDAVWHRTSDGWHVILPHHGSQREDERTTDSHSPGKPVLTFPVKPRPTAHAIVDVYAPYEDPYYCADGSSAAECGSSGLPSKVSLRFQTAVKTRTTSKKP